MSDPGMTLEQYQQMQDMQKRQAMAAALMKPSGQQNAAYGGIANMGSALLGAQMASNAQTDQSNMLNQMRYAAAPDNPVQLGKMAGANGGQFDLGTVNAKTPLIQSKAPNIFSNLFNLGGGS